MSEQEGQKGAEEPGAGNEPGAESAYVRFLDWLNHKLFGVIGPPPVGPYDEVVKRVGDAVCPVCGRPMTEHTIDHSTPNAILNCPVEHRPEPAEDEPFNELGMPKHE